MGFPIHTPTRFLLFTGKGGVGKTSAACATAVALADQGRRVLLVSTDPASNLDAVFSVRLSNRPRPIPGASGLEALNIDPEAAASAYRERVVGPYRGVLPADAVAGIEEQLSGACTVEIAAFDEFTALIAPDGEGAAFDHVIFDTAPTGHTLRLLSLPAAWSGFLQTNAHGASCLGPHSALKTQQARYEATVRALGDPAQTTVMLVTRPEQSAVAEAERSSADLGAQGLANQWLLVNGVFHATQRDDEVALALEARGERTLATLPSSLAALPRLEVPLYADNMLGLDALRRFHAPAEQGAVDVPAQVLQEAEALAAMSSLVDEVAAKGHGLVMLMGKGGVGKTTLAAALAVALADRGAKVHLTTTDPAAHIAAALNGSLANLKVSRIDPAAETRAYRERVLERSRPHLDAEGLALLEEDLRSPCTEEVAVFHAFSHIVFGARNEIVVMDTAPTGHTLLLLDAAGSYHREMARKLGGKALKTPMVQLQDPEFTRVVLVTLAEPTPVLEAAALQDDLRRARIEPYAWAINNSLAAAGSHDPLLQQRAALELAQIAQVREQWAKRVFVVPWLADEPVGAERLRLLLHDAMPPPTPSEPPHTPIRS